MAGKPDRVKFRSSGIRLGDLHRTFDGEPGKIRRGEPCRAPGREKPVRVKFRSSGIRLRDLYRTFDEEKPGRRRGWQWLRGQAARLARRHGGAQPVHD